MIQFYLNDEQLDLPSSEYEKDGKLIDLFQHTNSIVAKYNHVISKIIVDDKSILNTPEEENYLQDTMSSFHHIYFSSIHRIALAYDALETIFLLVNKIHTNSKEIKREHQLLNFHHANVLFGDLIDDIDNLIQLFTSIYQVYKLEYPENFENYPEYDNNEKQFLESIKKLASAREKNDETLLYDLLEHNLAASLNRWIEESSHKFMEITPEEYKAIPHEEDPKYLNHSQTRSQSET